MPSSGSFRLVCWACIPFSLKTPWGWHSSVATSRSLILVTNCISLSHYVGWGSKCKSRLALGSIQPLIQWVMGALSPGVKQQGHVGDHSRPYSTKFKNEYSYTSTHPYVFMTYTETTFPFFIFMYTVVTQMVLKHGSLQVTKYSSCGIMVTLLCCLYNAQVLMQPADQQDQTSMHTHVHTELQCTTPAISQNNDTHIYHFQLKNFKKFWS
jgi:hypothetical protein